MTEDLKPSVIQPRPLVRPWRVLGIAVCGIVILVVLVAIFGGIGVEGY